MLTEMFRLTPEASIYIFLIIRMEKGTPLCVDSCIALQSSLRFDLQTSDASCRAIPGERRVDASQTMRDLNLNSSGVEICY